MIVDASAFLEFVLFPETQPRVEEIVRSGSASAPALFDAEVLSRLVKNHKRGALTRERVEQALEDLRVAPIERVSHAGLLHDAWRRSAALSAYDALYVALAAQRGVGLVTADRRLANAPKLDISVTVVPTSQNEQPDTNT
jgi:predicted nucleic acid-binding protein